MYIARYIRVSEHAHAYKIKVAKILVFFNNQEYFQIIEFNVQNFKIDFFFLNQA